jgi:hypothetical protein
MNVLSHDELMQFHEDHIDGEWLSSYPEIEEEGASPLE